MKRFNFLESNLNASKFKNKIDSFSRSLTVACNDLNAIQDAKELVPLAQIVQDNLNILEGNYKDNLLPHLVDWFSDEFFAWFQQPDCECCHNQLEINKIFINVEGNKVESYKCNNGTCNSNYTYDIIRHNDPAILLRTRRGRCGEWANCFMLFLRAFDYEARMVLDTTDHVWNEVWSESRGRWLHVDPCEGIIDCPLLYELGWNKKLEYCLAFSQFEVLDVTRRYSAHYAATKLRRTSCDEFWLEQYLDELTSELLLNVTPQDDVRDGILERRKLDKKQLSELPMGPRSLPDGMKLNGRKTGDLSWRIARGEFSPIMENRFVIKVKSCDSGSEPKNPLDGGPVLFELHYNSLKNSYESSLPDLTKRGWSSLSYLSENLDYKYERDWKTSYISRYESCPSEKIGKLQWRFDLGELSRWSKLGIQLNNCAVYSGTTIKLSLKCHGNDLEVDELKLDLNKMNYVSSEQFKTKIVMIDLMVELSGGEPDDEVAWQKPQIFRQTRGKNDLESSLTFRAYLN